MKYELIGRNNFLNPIETILYNRGINDVERYLNASAKDVIHHSKLKNIDKAVELLISKVKRGGLKVFVQVDADL